MKKIVAMAVLASSAVGFSMSASAACTQEEMMEKAQNVHAKLLELASKDPQKMMQISQEMQIKAAELQKNSAPEAACEYYDELLKAP